LASFSFSIEARSKYPRIDSGPSPSRGGPELVLGACRATRRTGDSAGDRRSLARSRTVRAGRSPSPVGRSPPSGLALVNRTIRPGWRPAAALRRAEERSRGAGLDRYDRPPRARRRDRRRILPRLRRTVRPRPRPRAWTRASVRR
jgi:hypothetical protein